MPPNLTSFLPDCDEPNISLTSRADLAKLPPDKCKQLRFISETHVASFDWYLNTGLPTIPDAIDPREFQFDPNDDDSRFKLEIERIEVEKPINSDAKYRTIFPSECRQRKTDYLAPVHATCKCKTQNVVRKHDFIIFS